MNLVEKMVRAYQNNEPMPLKGHTKITLTDVKTGKTKVVEKDNMVTNAVADIFAKNWSGLARFSSLLPLKNLFSGVLCFEGEITEDADEYFPPNDEVNECICHAGPDAHTTAEANRGQPNVAEWDVQDTSIKFVWDFSTSVQGEIRTVCLCPGTLGNMGLKPFAATYNPISGFGDNRYQDTSWSETRAKQYPFTIASDGKSAKMLWCNGTTFTDRTMRHDYFAFGIMRSSTDWQEVSSRTATLSTSFQNRHSFIFDDDDYYYVATPSSSSFTIDKISKTDMTVTTSTLSPTGVSLFTGDLGINDIQPNRFMRVFAFDGTYLYYPNSSANKFYKINLTVPADVTEIPDTITINPAMADGNDGDQFASPIVISDGLILGDNYVINGNHAYQIAQTKQIGGSGGYSAGTRYLDLVKMGAAVYGNGICYYSGQTAGQVNVFNQMVLSTINVLDDVINKTTSTTMKIEYTIMEV